MAGDEQKVAASGLAKYFNGETIAGRANVAKATYAAIAILILYFKMKQKRKRKMEPPLPSPPSSTSTTIPPVSKNCNKVEKNFQLEDANAISKNNTKIVTTKPNGDNKIKKDLKEVTAKTSIEHKITKISSKTENNKIKRDSKEKIKKEIKNSKNPDKKLKAEEIKRVTPNLDDFDIKKIHCENIPFHLLNLENKNIARDDNFRIPFVSDNSLNDSISNNKAHESNYHIAYLLENLKSHLPIVEGQAIDSAVSKTPFLYRTNPLKFNFTKFLIEKKPRINLFPATVFLNNNPNTEQETLFTSRKIIISKETYSKKLCNLQKEFGILKILKELTNTPLLNFETL